MADIVVRVDSAHFDANGNLEVQCHYHTTDGVHGTTAVTVFGANSPSEQNADILTAVRSYCAATFGTLAGKDFLAVGVPGSWVFVPKKGTQIVNNSSVLVDDDTLVLPLTTANRFYHVRLRVFFETTASADFKYRLSVDATSTDIRRHILRGAANVAPAEQAIATAFDSADIPLTSTAEGQGIIFEDVVFTAGTSTTLKFRWAQNSAQVADTKVWEGSYLEWAAWT